MLQRMLMSVLHMFGNREFCKIMINDYKSKCLYVGSYSKHYSLHSFTSGSLIGFLNSTSIVSKGA